MNTKNAKITFDLSRNKVIIEGSESELVQFIQSLQKIAPSFEIAVAPRVAHSSNQQEAEVLGSHGALSHSTRPESEKKLGVREFAKPLPLNNAYERIAALVYYANKYAQKDVVSIKQVSDWFGLCGFQKPNHLTTAFSDAKRKYDYIVSRGRDQWAISTAGENLIMELLERQRA